MKYLTYEIIERIADNKIELDEWKPGHFRLFWSINGIQFNCLTQMNYSHCYAIECEDWEKVLGAFAVANLTMPAPDENDDQI